MSNYILPEIISCGYFNCREQFGLLERSPERVSRYIEIELFLEDGDATFINGKRLEIKKNYIIVAKPDSVRYSILPFKTAFLKLSCEGEIYNTFCNLPDYFPSVHTDKILEILNAVFLLNEEKEKNQLLIGSKILALTDLLMRDAGFVSVEGGAAYPLMHAAKKFIEQNYGSKISTADIAASVNLSESRCRFLFGRTYNITPHQYLVNVRIAAAKQLLWDENSISEIAEKCGFGCQQYFNDIFKRETGISPGKFKKDLARRYND